MHRVIVFRVGGRQLHLVKLLGSLVFFGCAIGFLNSFYMVFLTADRMAAFMANTVEARVAGFPNGVSDSDALGMVLGPTAQALLWLAGFVLGFVLYKAGEFILPVEEDIQDYDVGPQASVPKPEPRHVKRSKKK